MRRPMHRIAFTILAAGFISACAQSEPEVVSSVGIATPIATEQNELQQILDRGSLRVGTTGDYYLSDRDAATGARSGFDIELTTKLAQDMGVEVEYVSTDWPSLVSGLTAGRYDITTGASYTTGRARTASYSIPIATVGTVALVRVEDVDRFSSWDRINQPGVVVAVPHGVMVAEYAKELVPNAELLSVEVPESAYEEVVAGRADVVLASLVDAAEQVASGSALVMPQIEARNANFVGLLLRQGDNELRSFVDAWIRAQECSGFLGELTTKYHLSL
jgi:cyclohexadienyl dehydratase